MADITSTGGTSNANVARIAIDQRRKKGTDVVEPQVISQDFLIKGVEEPLRPDGEPWEPIDFPAVTSLRLSFKNIIEVSNLNNFDSLTTLRLDNNIIDKIANLNHLNQLTWLDLSFNNIREIEGLGQLHNLLDLSLYHNQITEIKGLDGCPNLNILSLGHNCISELKQIDYLRNFKNLRCVCLDGNKVCQLDAYNQHVLAYLPTLKYLDYMLIDRKAVTQAQEGYNLDDLTDIKEREQSEEDRLKAQREKKEVVAKLKGAFLDYTEDLFEELFSKQAEPEHLTVLTCYPPLKEAYKEALLEDIKNLRTWMTEKNDSRVKKVSAFEKAVTRAEKESEEEAFQMVGDFQSHKKKVLASLESATQGEQQGLRPDQEAMIQQLKDQLEELGSHLMAAEVQLQESITEAISDFEIKISEIMKLMNEKAGEFFRHLEDHENNFKNQLMNDANNELESAQNPDSVSADMDPHKAVLLASKDEVIGNIGNFNEAHMLLLQNKEDYMTSSMKTWETEYSKKHRDRQYKRNRQRVMDIESTLNDCRNEIQAASEVGDEYDGDGDGVDMYGGR